MTADGAWDARRCHDAIAARGAQAVIPPRKNAKPWKPTSPGAIARNEPGTKQSMHRDTWAERSGEDGAGITAEAG